MSNILVINASGQETRVALIEQGTISEYYLERKNEKGIVGNIYKGKVIRVLPGMQAAFVDIGLDKAAFLYVGDIRDDLDEGFGDGEGERNLKDDDAAPISDTKTPIQELLKEGQHILVQVAKDPLGTKGARLTTHISLPGR